MWAYPVILTPDPETRAVVVDFPDIPFCHSAGDDEDEALLNAEDALAGALAVYVERRLAIPAPSDPAPGQPVVPLSALTAAKALLWNELQAQGVRKAELARRLGWHLPQVDRLLDFGHRSRMDQIELALAALGRRLEVRLAA
ncbi:type II toxin-antitoxin system HicB family antitoxin [Methylomagnum sp.]